jgi:hypothetical protein
MPIESKLEAQKNTRLAQAKTQRPRLLPQCKDNRRLNALLPLLKLAKSPQSERRPSHPKKQTQKVPQLAHRQAHANR